MSKPKAPARPVRALVPALVVGLLAALVPLGGIGAAPGSPGPPEALLEQLTPPGAPLAPAPGPASFGAVLEPAESDDPVDPVEIALHVPGHPFPLPTIAPILITICHIPPENPAALGEIQVPPTDIGMHLAHGDHLGSCDGGPGVNKVTICHVPPGNPENAHTITIGEPAVQAHMNHGDEEGACEDDEGAPDVALDKVLSFDAGEEFLVIFGLTVMNVGDATAQNVELFDTLIDLGDGWVLGGLDAADCDLDGLDLECAFGDLEPGEQRTIAVWTGFEDEPCETTVANTAIVTADEDADPTNNVDEVLFVFPACPEEPGEPDVALEKAVGLANVGDDFVLTYGFIVSNIGDETAEDVELFDTLPDLGAPWTLSGPDQDDCVIDGLDLECAFGDLEPGEARTVNVSVVLDEGPCGVVLENEAIAIANEDVNQTNNVASVLLEFPECPEAPGEPDVALDKDVEQSEENGLDLVVFILTVSSVGNETATNVVLTDTLPDLGVAWTLDGPDADACSLVALELVCDFGDLAPGAERVVEVHSALCDLGCGPDLVNTALVVADADVDLSNNEATAVILRVPCPEPEPEPEADVGVEKAGSLAALDGGGFEVEYEIVVTSLGEATALNVTLQDELPPFVWTLDGPDAGDCAVVDGVLSCAFGDLAPGETRVVGLLATSCTFGCGDLVNTATVAAANDSVVGNNSDTVVLELLDCPRFR